VWIDLQWAMTERDSALRPCEMCEAEFEPRSVVVHIAPYGYEICDGCAEALLKTRAARGGVRADWPTWDEYQAALREHPEPMMSSEELERAEELGLYDDFFGLAQLREQG